MRRRSINALNAIENGVAPILKVTVHFQQPETYTLSDRLIAIGRRVTSMSSEGRYEIANTTIQLKEEDHYFARKFARELPVRRLVEITARIGDEEDTVFSGVVQAGRGGWQLQSGVLTLQVNA